METELGQLTYLCTIIIILVVKKILLKIFDCISNGDGTRAIVGVNICTSMMILITNDDDSSSYRLIATGMCRTKRIL